MNQPGGGCLGGCFGVCAFLFVFVGLVAVTIRAPLVGTGGVLVLAGTVAAVAQRAQTSPTVVAVAQPAPSALDAGRVTGDLRIEDRGVDRTRRAGGMDRLTIHTWLRNEGNRPIVLDNVADVDLQVWDPLGHLIGLDVTWPTVTLPAGQSCAADITVAADHPVDAWAIGHHACDYLFFPSRSSHDTPNRFHRFAARSTGRCHYLTVGVRQR